MKRWLVMTYDLVDNWKDRDLLVIDASGSFAVVVMAPDEKAAQARAAAIWAEGPQRELNGAWYAPPAQEAEVPLMAVRLFKDQEIVVRGGRMLTPMWQAQRRMERNGFELVQTQGVVDDGSEAATGTAE